MIYLWFLFKIKLLTLCEEFYTQYLGFTICGENPIGFHIRVGTSALSPLSPLVD